MAYSFWTCPDDTSATLWQGVVWTRGDTTALSEFTLSPSVMSDTSATSDSYIFYFTFFIYFTFTEAGQAYPTLASSSDTSGQPLARGNPRFKHVFYIDALDHVPHAGTVVAAIDRAAAELRRIDRSPSFVKVPVRCRPALLCQACARAAQATQPLSRAAQLLSVDRCTLASTAFDVAAAILESSSTLWAPRPDLLYRSGRGTFQRVYEPAFG